MTSDLVTCIVRLFEERGGQWYGAEAVTQLEHALQCAALAESHGAADDLVTASLLHDLGHLMATPVASPGGVRTDDKHEFRPIRMLKRAFGDGVLAPIRLHVAAKRYLCAVEPDYRGALSPASRLSLELQGGPFDAREAAAFIAQPYAADALRLRLWDDRAKEPGKPTPELAHYTHILMRCAHEHRDPQGQT